MLKHVKHPLDLELFPAANALRSSFFVFLKECTCFNLCLILAASQMVTDITKVI